MTRLKIPEKDNLAFKQTWNSKYL